MAVVIMTNCVSMGIEADTLLGYGGSGVRAFLNVSEHVFTAIFLFELLARVMIHGWQSFVPMLGDIFAFMDACLVLLTGVLVSWILPLFQVDTGGMRVLTILRAFRLLRLVRIVRKVELFCDVWKLLHGLMDSMRTIFWTIIVIFAITYVFAVFGVVLISVTLQSISDESERDPKMAHLIRITDGIMAMSYTLIQVFTLDSWNDNICRPIMEHISWVWIFFYCYISIAVLVLLNLVTAIIVDNAIQTSQKDTEGALAQKENDWNRELQQFELLFGQVDQDNDGELTRDEFIAAFHHPDIRTKLELLDFAPEDCEELFDLLDAGDGSLSLSEFFVGISRMKGKAGSRDTFRVVKMAEYLQKLVTQHANEMQEDFAELIRHTPGAELHKRKGTLKQRAAVLAEKRAETSPLTAEELLRPHGGDVQEPDLSNLLKQFDSVSAELSVYQQEMQCGFDSCDSSVGSLSKQAAQLKANTASASQRLGVLEAKANCASVAPVPREVGCCSTGT